MYEAQDIRSRRTLTPMEARAEEHRVRQHCILLSRPEKPRRAYRGTRNQWHLRNA